MQKQLLSAIFIAFATHSLPAFAGSWDADKAVCAEAIAAEAGVDVAQYNATLIKARQRGARQVTVELTADGAATLVGECKVKGGQVVDLALKA